MNAKTQDNDSYALKLWMLFYNFAKIVFFVVGGGYAILPMTEDEFVRKRKWLTSEELLDMLAIVQTLPGIIACNAAIYIGFRVAKIPGAIAAALGSIFPSLIIIILVAMGLDTIQQHLELPAVQGAFVCVRAAICGLIVATALKLGKKVLTGIFEWIVAAGAFIALYLFSANPIYIIIVAAIAGIPYCYFIACRIKKVAALDGLEEKEN